MTTVIYRKYRSFIVSCVIHALVFLVLLYTRMQQNPEQLFPPTKLPAKVHLERSFLQSTQQLGTQPQEDHVDQDKNELVQKVAPKEVKAPPGETISHEIQQPINSSSSQDENSYDKGLEKSFSMPSGPRSTVSREAFMKAFTSAIQKVPVGPSTQSSQEGFKGPTHVKERLKEWGQYHYKEKLYGALRRASKFAATTMHHERSLEKMAQITITIKKDGTLGILSKQQLSGIKEVDEHLLKVLQTADFPPIPDRYGTDTFVFTLPIRISLQAGSGVYRLFV